MRLFSNILLVVDERDPTFALKRAVAMTQRDGATLTLVSVVETMVSASPSGHFHDELSEAFEALRDKRRARLTEIAKSVPASIETVCEVMDGRAHLEVIKRVQLYQHDLVVARAAEDSSAINRIFVSEDMQLLRKCPCPILLLKPSSGKRFKRVLAAVDFDHTTADGTETANAGLNGDILDMAATIADQDDSHLDVINIFDVPGEGAMAAGWIPMAPDNLADYTQGCRKEARKRLDASVADSRARTRLPIYETERVATHLIKGRARADIPEQADKLGTDLIVMGTVGRGGIPGLLIGNTAETILSRIDCSVLALKPEGFVSPVTPGE